MNNQYKNQQQMYRNWNYIILLSFLTRNTLTVIVEVSRNFPLKLYEEQLEREMYAHIHTRIHTCASAYTNRHKRQQDVKNVLPHIVKHAVH